MISWLHHKLIASSEYGRFKSLKWFQIKHFLIHTISKNSQRVNFGWCKKLACHQSCNTLYCESSSWTDIFQGIEILNSYRNGNSNELFVAKKCEKALGWMGGSMKKTNKYLFWFKVKHMLPFGMVSHVLLIAIIPICLTILLHAFTPYYWTQIFPMVNLCYLTSSHIHLTLFTMLFHTRGFPIEVWWQAHFDTSNFPMSFDLMLKP